MLVLNPFTHDTRVLKEASSLAGAGFDVTVWAIKILGVPARERTREFQVKRFRQSLRSLPIRPPGLVYAETIVKAALHLLQERADVYHAHDAKALPACYLAARVRKALLIYDAHEFLLSAGGSDWRSRVKSGLWLFLERSLIRYAQEIITVNVSIAQELTRLYDVEPLVLMNCQEFTDTRRNNVLRQEFSISKDDRIAIYAGILAPGRGLEQMIHAARYLDDVVLVLMGPDRLEGKLQKLVRDLGVKDRVKIRAPVPPEDVAYYVASADIGVTATQAINPSYYYSLENKLLHYVMAGIPAAVSDHPEKRRLVETYDVCATFDETDPRSIAETIKSLLRHRHRYRQMCRNAKEAARAELNWSVEEQKLLNLYRSLQISR